MVSRVSPAVEGRGGTSVPSVAVFASPEARGRTMRVTRFMSDRSRSPGSEQAPNNTAANSTR